MNADLQANAYIDHSHPAIACKAAELACGGTTDQKNAANCFEVSLSANRVDTAGIGGKIRTPAKLPRSFPTVRDIAMPKWHISVWGR